MRVIAGRYRGRRLLAPVGCRTRPILDRVKVSLFDWLGARLAKPGKLPGIDVLDIFCGSGSLGIESLSRGASSCTFVETDLQALQCLRRNIHELGLNDIARIVTRPAEGLRIQGTGGPRFGLIFLDPPYEMSMNMEPDSLLRRVIARLGEEVAVTPEALLMWRHPASCDMASRIGAWISSERRVWGRMAITMLQKTDEESQ